MFNIKQHIGKFGAWFIIAGLMVTVITSIMGVMAVVTEVVMEWLRSFTTGSGISTLALASVFLLLLLYLFWTGRHRLFLRFISLMVGVMGIAFVITNFMIVHDPGSIFRGFIPHIPDAGEPQIIIAGMVGTTMAAVVLVSRSMVIAEKGWKPSELGLERRDAVISATVLFLISAAIMASAAGSLYPQGIRVDNAIEMVNTLTPLAGRFAMGIFVIGIMAAGLSSIFPNMLLLPWLISDYSGMPRDMTKPLYRTLAVIVGLSALIVPVFGGRPVPLMIASQAFSPLMMPVLIIFLLILLNNKKIMKEYSIGLWLNAGLIVTLLFSLFMFYVAYEGYMEFFK